MDHVQDDVVLGVAALVRRSNGSVAEARVGLPNMGPVPVRARAAEDAARQLILTYDT